MGKIINIGTLYITVKLPGQIYRHRIASDLTKTSTGWPINQVTRQEWLKQRRNKHHWETKDTNDTMEQGSTKKVSSLKGKVWECKAKCSDSKVNTPRKANSRILWRTSKGMQDGFTRSTPQNYSS